MFKRIMTYNFSANLRKENGEIYEVGFQVLENENIKHAGEYYAEKRLREYLSDPEQVKNEYGWIYEECVGVKLIPGSSVIMEIPDNTTKMNPSIDVIDIGVFTLLERKYGKELENYDEERNDYFINECIESNNRCLDLMKSYQEHLFNSIKLNNEDKNYKELIMARNGFIECLEDMKRLVSSLNIAVSKPNKNKEQ